MKPLSYAELSNKEKEYLIRNAEISDKQIATDIAETKKEIQYLRAENTRIFRLYRNQVRTQSMKARANDTQIAEMTCFIKDLERLQRLRLAS